MPLSKSVSNRLLILDYLYDIGLDLSTLSEAADTELLIDLLQRPLPTVLDCRDAGTVMRYLTAVASSQLQTTQLRGTDRMHQRPITALVDTLQRAGADIDYELQPGYPPLLVTGAKLQGSQWEVDSDKSSQYASALAMLLPYCERDMQLRLIGSPVSLPYIDMTLQLMQRLGMEIARRDKLIDYQHTDSSYHTVYRCPSDYSALGFMILELSARAGEIRVEELSEPDGIQGDERVLDFCSHLGIKKNRQSSSLLLSRERDSERATDLPLFDFTEIPDLALPMITALSLHHPEIRVTGIQTLNLKESERWEILQDILFTLGCKTYKHDDVYTIKKVQDRFEILDLDDHSDHRVVMTLASLSSLFERTVIYHPEAVQKSYPDYWEQFSA